MNWSGQRKVVYGVGLFVFIVLVLIYLFRATLFPTPTCFDTKQNGYETGVDCGGTCSLRCSQDIIPLSVAWSRAVHSASSTYDFVAFVTNRNIDNAPKQVEYTFIAYDQGGNEMARLTGMTAVPVGGDFPIVRQNIVLPSEPSHVSATVNDTVPHYTALEKPTSSTLAVSATRYEEGVVPRVYATITNQKRLLLRNIPVRVLLYDADGNVFGAGETLIPELGKEQSKDIVFTWNNAFPQAPTKIRVFPILDPFLGTL